MRYTEKDREFFSQDAAELAPKLLGKFLCTKKQDGTILKLTIMETEAYPAKDTTCYGYGYDGNFGNKKITPAIQPLFKRGGACCVYGGMLLIVCGPVQKPENILVRKAGNKNVLCEGPYLLGKLLNLNKQQHGMDLLSEKSTIWIETSSAEREIFKTTRVRLKANAKPCDIKNKLRFILI